MENQKLLCLDIETVTWFDMPHIKPLPRELQLAAMEYGCAVTWDNSGAASTFWWNTDGEIDITTLPKDVSEFEFWGDTDPCYLFEYLHEFDLVMGWNIIGFDIPILARAAGMSITHRFPKVFDLFAIIKEITGRWYKLQDVALANLGRGKTGDGRQAAQWLAEGELYKAADYCRVDVELERDLCSWALAGSVIKLPPLSRSGQDTEMLLTLDWENRGYTLGGKF